MTIFYKVGDPDVMIQTPNIIWDTNAGRAGLDEISVDNNWHITNVGNATALWNAVDMTTLTINFNDTTPGKDVAVTVATNERVTTGVGIHIFADDEWQEAINAIVQGTMLTYFIENGDWTLNANGVKGFTDAVTFAAQYDGLTAEDGHVKIGSIDVDEPIGLADTDNLDAAD